MYNRGLTKDWVPKIGILLLIILLLFTFMLVNPIYSSNMGQMVGSTGIMSEYFVWANFASTIGMAAAIPLVMRFKMRFRSKELMVSSLLTMAVLSVAIATTMSPEVIVGSAFLFGFAKMFGMIEVILPVMFILSPTGDKGRFYSLFYPIAIIAGQVGGLIAANVSLGYDWQSIHMYAAATLLLVALICTVVMHDLRFSRKMPLYQIDWLSIVLFSASMLSLAYVFAFGRQQAWFVSTSIQYAAVASIALAVCLVVRQQFLKRPYMTFGLFKKANVRIGVVLLIGLGMFMGAGSIQSIYTNAILGYNWKINASLSLMTMPGMVIAGFVGFHWTKHKLPIKMYIFSGFAAYVLNYVILYFMMVPGLSIDWFLLPQLLNGYGMCSLFIAIWLYGLNGIPQNDMLTSVGSVMVFRSFIATAFFGALFSWVQYALQWQSVNNLAFYFDATIMNTYGTVGNFGQMQLDAILAANKTLLGYVIIAGLAFLTFIFFHQFGNFKYRIARYRIRKSEWESRRDGKVDATTSAGAEDVAGIV
ncbi:efflux MFS transporter permease [Sphingobacterium haloxyli]|uniref:MFS transporter n=1 Tax=Sphingobacterium haloxyli TaxID=2100533 RepID=A0A2S9J4M4_9SPHI|nr:MFS transporter [Sphingobacterium haloxyli]PRD47737.1 MFS transporter [Sphingobacterium haloxyli]